MIVMLFGAIYYGLLFANQPLIRGNEPLTKNINGLENSVYFSFITALTIGYNDITPSGYSKLAVIIEAILSLATLGLFIGKIVAEHQEEFEHEITTEELTNAAVTELYIYRNDIKDLPVKKKSLKDYESSLASLKLALTNIKNADVQDTVKAELVINSINFSLSKTIETTERFNQWLKGSTTATECQTIAQEIYEQYKSKQFQNTKVEEKLKDLNTTLQTLQESLGAVRR